MLAAGKTMCFQMIYAVEELGDQCKVVYARLPPETHILRDRRPSTAACPACWAKGQNN